MARQGRAKRGRARQGRGKVKPLERFAWWKKVLYGIDLLPYITSRVMMRQGRVWQGIARQGKARQGIHYAELGEARHGRITGHCYPMHSMVRPGKARQSKHIPDEHPLKLPRSG